MPRPRRRDNWDPKHATASARRLIEPPPLALVSLRRHGSRSRRLRVEVHAGASGLNAASSELA